MRVAVVIPRQASALVRVRRPCSCFCTAASGWEGKPLPGRPTRDRSGGGGWRDVGYRPAESSRHAPSAARNPPGKASKGRSMRSGVKRASTAEGKQKMLTWKINELAKTGMHQLVRPTMKQAEDAGTVLVGTHFGAAIKAMARSNQWREAEELWGELQSRGLRASVQSYNSYISAFSRAGKLEDALRVFEELKASGQQPDVFSYSAAVAACAKAGEQAKAQQLLDEMRAEGVPPNVVTYTSAIEAKGKAGHWQGALDMLERMKADGIEPNRFTFNALITACGRGGQWKRALEMFNHLESAGSKELRPDSTTYGGLIYSFAQTGMWKEAVDAFGEMKMRRLRPNNVTYQSLITAYHKAGLVEQAVGVLDEMREGGHRPDHITYCSLLNICAEFERYDIGEELYEELVASMRPAVRWTEKGMLDVTRCRTGLAIFATRAALQGLLENEKKQNSDLILILGFHRERSAEHGLGAVGNAITVNLSKLNPPVRCRADPDDPRRLVIPSSELKHWCLHQDQEKAD